MLRTCGPVKSSLSVVGDATDFSISDSDANIPTNMPNPTINNGTTNVDIQKLLELTSLVYSLRIIKPNDDIILSILSITNK